MSEPDRMTLARVPSGIGGLDVILQGGFLRGGLYIIQGTPGTGKTTMANQICFSHAADGGRALYVTLLAEYHARMMQHLSNMSFFDRTKIPDEIKYLNGFRILREQGYAGLRDMLRREIVAHNATILVIDGFATAQRQEAVSQEFNEFVHELQGVATATDCTMFLLTSAVGTRQTPEYTMVDGIVELTDQLAGWSAESTLQVIKLRGSGYLRGRHAFRIIKDGLVIYPRIEALLARPSRPDTVPAVSISSGLDQLDIMLGGGLPMASTTTVMGPTGLGKTTLGLQFLSRSSEAEPGLLFGFYETPTRLGAKVDGVCPPLRPLLDSRIVEILWQPPTDGLLDLYGERLLQAVRGRGVKRLVIDGLNAFQSASPDPVRLSQYMTALVNELRALGVTTIYTFVVPDITAPHTRATVDDGFLSLSDNLILMRYAQVGSRLHRLISIIKVRDKSFDADTHEYATTGKGVDIQATPASAEAILAQSPYQAHDPSDAVEPQTEHGG